MVSPRIKDTNWVRQSFLVSSDNLAPLDHQRRFFSTASTKFTDTSPGGNLPINPPPQFTRYADIKSKGQFAGSNGMGRYYSEAIDDNSQLIYMRFGVPQFNSLTQFFTGFYNTGAGQLARTGRANSAFYYLGRAAGFVISVISWKLLAVQLLGAGVRFALEKPSSKYYYLKPTMPLYWNAVTTMINHIAVNRGIVPRVGGGDQSSLNDNYEFDSQALKRLHDLLPDVFKEKGGIDVYAMANRAQRLARKRQLLEQELLNQQTNSDLTTQIQLLVNTQLSDDKPDYNDYLKRWFDSAPSQEKKDSADYNSSTEKVNYEASWFSNFLDFSVAELNDGSAFACFRVNSTGPVSESFSNTVTESEIANKINSMSSAARSTNFTFGHGNLIGGAVGDVVGGIIGAAKDLVAGVGAQLEISGLAALSGSAFVDIPKHWQSSVAQLPRMSYTINLVSPYGNPISQLINLHVPLCMLLAGALPLSTGKQSYTSPFIMEIYDQGRCQSRLAMIDSLSITRGTGNLGFDRLGHAMGIDVSFTVVDLSSVMHMPIAEGFSLAGAAVAAVGNAAATAAIANPGAAAAVAVAAPGAAVAVAAAAVTSGTFDDTTVFSDYMAVLGAMGLADQIYPFRRLKLNLTRQAQDYDRWTSPAKWAGMMGDTVPGRLLSAFPYFPGRTR